MASWALQDAKNKLSEVVQRAGSEGPQELTVRGKRTAVVISAAEYDKLIGPRQSFVDALLSGPDWGDELVEAINQRPRWQARDVEL